MILMVKQSLQIENGSEQNRNIKSLFCPVKAALFFHRGVTHSVGGSAFDRTPRNARQN